MMSSKCNKEIYNEVIYNAQISSSHEHTNIDKYTQTFKAR